MAEITVVVKLFASLLEHSPRTPRKNMPSGSTVNDLIRALGLPVDGRYIVLVNTLPEWNSGRILAHGDVVAIFPPLAGG